MGLCKFFDGTLIKMSRPGCAMTFAGSFGYCYLLLSRSTKVAFFWQFAQSLPRAFRSPSPLASGLSRVNGCKMRSCAALAMQLAGVSGAFCAWCCWLSVAFIPPWNQQSIKEVLHRAALIHRRISEASSCCFITIFLPHYSSHCHLFSACPEQRRRRSTTEALASPRATAPPHHYSALLTFGLPIRQRVREDIRRVRSHFISHYSIIIVVVVIFNNIGFVNKINLTNMFKLNIEKRSNHSYMDNLHKYVDHPPLILHPPS